MKGQVFHRQLRFCPSDSLAEQTAEAAAAEGETLSSVMRLALREWLAKSRATVAHRTKRELTKTGGQGAMTGEAMPQRDRPDRPGAASITELIGAMRRITDLLNSLGMHADGGPQWVPGNKAFFTDQRNRST